MLPVMLCALTRYGQRLGLLFQITDDILDVVGNAATLGARGKGCPHGKATILPFWACKAHVIWLVMPPTRRWRLFVILTGGRPVSSTGPIFPNATNKEFRRRSSYWRYWPVPLPLLTCIRSRRKRKFKTKALFPWMAAYGGGRGSHPETKAMLAPF